MQQPRRLRQFLKFALPFGLVDLGRNRRTLAYIGRRLRLTECLNSAWLVHEAEQSGLTLFPPGYAEHLKCVVDVGANEGQWLTMLLDCIQPEKLIVIEPEPAAFAILQKKFGEDRRFQLHNVAVGDHAGRAKLQITHDTTGASLLRPRAEMRDLIGSNWRVVSEAEVSVTTLDFLLRDLDEISLLKIDVQGFEASVLTGARESLAKTNFLLVELNYMPQYEGGSWFGELHQLLTRDHGFFLANASRPLLLNGRASMCDGLYVNPRRVKWVKPDFV